MGDIHEPRLRRSGQGCALHSILVLFPRREFSTASICSASYRSNSAECSKTYISYIHILPSYLIDYVLDLEFPVFITILSWVTTYSCLGLEAGSIDELIVMNQYLDKMWITSTCR